MGFFQKGGEKVYFDIHSHILPGIDDGAKDITESAELINFMKKEGITEVIATPHFYPNEMSLGDFLEHRNNAYETLCSNLDGDIPRIYIGCEILYFKRMGASLFSPCMIIQFSPTCFDCLCHYILIQISQVRS